MQNINLNVWVIQKWRDEFLGWNPQKYGLINTTILPFSLIWLPDTYVILYLSKVFSFYILNQNLQKIFLFRYLYNSVVMNREETERYINVVVNTEYWENKRGSQVKFMYPALYRFKFY